MGRFSLLLGGGNWSLTRKAGGEWGNPCAAALGKPVGSPAGWFPLVSEAQDLCRSLNAGVGMALPRQRMGWKIKMAFSGTSRCICTQCQNEVGVF